MSRSAYRGCILGRLLLSVCHLMRLERLMVHSAGRFRVLQDACHIQLILSEHHSPAWSALKRPQHIPWSGTKIWCNSDHVAFVVGVTSAAVSAIKDLLTCLLFQHYSGKGVHVRLRHAVFVWDQDSTPHCCHPSRRAEATSRM